MCNPLPPRITKSCTTSSHRIFLPPSPHLPTLSVSPLVLRAASFPPSSGLATPLPHSQLRPRLPSPPRAAAASSSPTSPLHRRLLPRSCAPPSPPPPLLCSANASSPAPPLLRSANASSPTPPLRRHLLPTPRHRLLLPPLLRSAASSPLLRSVLTSSAAPSPPPRSSRCRHLLHPALPPPPPAPPPASPLPPSRGDYESASAVGMMPVNIRGEPIAEADLSKTSGWIAVLFIFGNEMAERKAYYALSVNNFLGISHASSVLSGFLTDIYLS